MKALSDKRIPDSAFNLLACPQSMAATLSDVARQAGVSLATASRVLNGTHASLPISAATRKRVWAAAQELSYRPNLTARSLAQGATRMIGVVLPQDAAVRAPIMPHCSRTAASTGV